ncbi:MAG: hypothetical protein GY845_25680 [Planctomycetes bacterium]|nr:hypothetical protein [Planctomycetota bacterium]
MTYEDFSIVYSDGLKKLLVPQSFTGSAYYACLLRVSQLADDCPEFVERFERDQAIKHMGKMFEMTI